MDILTLLFPRVFVQIVAPFIDVDLLLKSDAGVQVLKKLADKWLRNCDRESLESKRRYPYDTPHRLQQQMKTFFSCVLCEKTSHNLHRRTCRTCRQDLGKYQRRHCRMCKCAFARGKTETEYHLHNYFEKGVYVGSYCKTPEIRHEFVCYQCERIPVYLKWVDGFDVVFCGVCGDDLSKRCPDLKWEEVD